MTFARTSVLRQLVNGMFTFAAVFSREGVLLEANPSALALVDRPPEDLYGKHFSEIETLSFSVESRVQVGQLLQRAAHGEVVREEMRVRVPGGRIAVIDAMFLPLFDETHRVVLIGASGVEVTAHKDAEATLLKLNRQLRMLSSCNQILVRTDDETNLLRQVCEVIVTEGGYRFVWVGFAERDAACTVRPVAWAGIDAGYLEKLHVTWAETPQGGGPTGRAIRQGSVEICRDISTDSSFERWRDEALALGYVCSVALPLSIGGSCVGALNIYSDQRMDFDDAELTLLTELANDLAYGIATLRTRAEHQRAQSQLQLFRRLLDRSEDMIYVLEAATGRILDASDAASRELGHTREELLQMTMPDISVTAGERPWPERVAELESAGPFIIDGQHRRKDGTIFPVEVSLSYVAQDQTRYIITVARDISERKRQQALIEHMARVLRMHSGINAAVLRIGDRDELLREACRIATHLGGYDRAVVSLTDPDGRHARPRFRAGRSTDFPEPPVLELSDGTMPDSNLVSRVLRTGEITVCNDLTRSEPPVANRELLVELGFKTLVALPLIVDGRRIGAMTLTSRDPALVGENELLLLQDMTDSLSFALRSQQHADAYQFLASYDSLTGLAKRSLFCQRLDDLLAQGMAPGAMPAVVAFDIHHLASINDAFGRRFGDLLLQRVAERLRRNAQNDERIGYLGGGTFILVETALSAAEEGVNSLLEALVFADTFSIDESKIRVSCRSGVARYPLDGIDSDTLVQKAEAALKRAKETGEQYLHYKLEMRSEVARRLALEQRLRNAVDDQQFELHYQPQINVETGRVDAVEALLRWQDPQRGLVAPEHFLQVLESSGLIVPVGNWVLSQAAQDCRRWLDKGLGPLRVGVNVSALQLRRRVFVEHVLGRVREALGDYRECLIDLEITETALLQDVEGASRKLRELRAAGIRIALDDFGTGYSSLGLLSKLPVDVLKIDRSFVKGLPDDPASVTLAGSIIGLASAFGLLTVAEGVQTPKQLELLRKLKCNYSQGYLHYPAMTSEALERILTSDLSGTPRPKA
jgi:diguanylate cyclase (GGDEF)-like protein/PAS domain S-box-containing protein